MQFLGANENVVSPSRNRNVAHGKTFYKMLILERERFCLEMSFQALFWCCPVLTTIAIKSYILMCRFNMLLQSLLDFCIKFTMAAIKYHYCMF